MPDNSLVAELGRSVGSPSSRRLRHAGLVPGVIYGHGMDPVSLAVDAKDLRRALSGPAGLNALLELEVGDQRHLAMAKSIQRHPVRGTVSHVDFQVVGRHERLLVEVTITLTGEAEQVRLADGMVEQQLFALPLRAAADAIPDSVEVDVSELAIGDSIRVADLRLPDDVDVDVDPETVVVAALAGRAAEEEEETEATAEGASAEATGD